MKRGRALTTDEQRQMFRALTPERVPQLQDQQKPGLLGEDDIPRMLGVGQQSGAFLTGVEDDMPAEGSMFHVLSC